MRKEIMEKTLNLTLSICVCVMMFMISSVCLMLSDGKLSLLSLAGIIISITALTIFSVKLKSH